MSDKNFNITLTIVIIVCLLITAFMVGYTIYLHDNCSIISYIANER